MQFLYFTILALPALITALPPTGRPSPRPYITPEQCNTNCLQVHSCVQTFPTSCHCEYQNAVYCAESCNLPKPPKPDCKKETKEKEVEARDADACREKCEGDVMCTQQWPQSCYCKNNTKKKCAKECGVPVGELPVCPKSA